jgi:hypothetical protein
VDAYHRGLADEHAVLPGSGDQPAGLRGVEGNGFFAQDVLANRGRTFRPWDMQVVWQRVVHSIDVRVSQQLLVGIVCPRNAQGARCL